MKLFNLLFITMGVVFTGLGMIGVLLPVLPTTPFLILASICFMRSSDKFDRWLRGTQVYKNYAEDFVNDRSMTLKRKAKLMLLSDAMLLFPLIRLNNLYLRLFIITIIAVKYWYFIFVIETKKE
ncbi:YbaN family protein [Tissierella pigra]|uniref:DUF454 domain-containing protein n=1 Tax=Tissierella pigra TaxID=2607614 RepID=A0A6N7XXP0_9FIRM|nr:YbaN family protein [Tissierella pigra]MBU5424811.1 YbaN family protein [Tissierella pigra]MSU02213.1 DUF454 domain-containing protein [Tissierella pigra]